MWGLDCLLKIGHPGKLYEFVQLQDDCFAALMRPKEEMIVSKSLEPEGLEFLNNKNVQTQHLKTNCVVCMQKEIQKFKIGKMQEPKHQQLTGDLQQLQC